jgi:hypothetical protein
LLAGLGAVAAVSAAGAVVVGRGAPVRKRRDEPADRDSAFPLIRRNPYLRNLALVVLLAATVGALADCAMKVEAVAHFPKGAPLARDGLVAGLSLDSFELRRRCGRALLALRPFSRRASSRRSPAGPRPGGSRRAGPPPARGGRPPRCGTSSRRPAPR